MKTFKHINIGSLEEAVSLLEKYGDRARVMAGGTDFLGTLKDKVHAEYPEVVVNLKTIPGLAYIEENEGTLKIGPLTKLSEIAKNRAIGEKFKILSEAVRSVASPQLRRMGTIGGNICQEPRCWYYRHADNTFHCTRKGGKYCNALTGENQYHSVFGAVRVGTPPCSAECPGGIDIPSYLNEIREGNMCEAAKILLEANPMPAVTGRVCPHYCEQTCNRGEFDEPISIRAIERFMGDYILEKAGEIVNAPEDEGRLGVAVVGSGPAGLSAAYYLRMHGHRVTVFDRMDEPGGMLMYAIPSNRLPKSVVKRFVRVLEDTGIVFNLKGDVGSDISMQELRGEFDSVFLASGAWSQPSIGLEGEALTKSGLEFLTNVKKGLKEIPGRRVVVIGGGNVAVDVAITAARLGAENVTLVCLECREEMPALEWEIEQAVEEGITIIPSWGPFKVLESDGKVTGIELVQCTSVFDKNGCFAPTLDSSVRKSLEADQIIMAVGQKTDLSFIDPEFALNIERGLIQIDTHTQQTSVPGVFAGGDVTSGPATVIESIAAGRRAAEAIHNYLLKGEASPFEAMTRKGSASLLNFKSDFLTRTSRVRMRELPLAERSVAAEDALGLSSDEIEKEADRCFNCGCVAVNASDIAPVLIALDAKIKTTKRTLEAGEFFSVGPKKTTVLDQDELVREVEIPATGPDTGSAYLKFRTRKSIDFPIVNVAAVLHQEGKTINDAKIVLGALAPVPLRAKKAENYLRGKELNQETAAAAAELVIQGVLILDKNRYKVEITKALTKRAILLAADRTLGS
ncbi:MAG: FAD binding domain-containing protein [Candidatus Aminicenantes bacterium]|nr:FAD binding domain-containing protein [Candidatus Aminicenantes bacterium]